jgi:hypothetical protein
MSRTLAILAISVLSSNLCAQVSPTTPEAPRMRIIEGPKIELAKENLTIISWTTDNPGGSPVHYGVVHWYRSKSPDRDRKISDPVEPGSFIDGFPCTP